MTEQNIQISRILLLAFGFLLLYTPIFGTQNAISLALENNGYGSLGFYSFGIVYISWGIGGIFSASICKRIGYRWSIFLGAFSNSVWMFSMLLTVFKRQIQSQQETLPFYESEWFVYLIVIMASIFNGFFNGPMWVSACSYIFACANKSSYPQYLSLFWIFYVSSQISGNALASFLFQNYEQEYFFIINGSLALLASCYFHLLKYDDESKDKPETQENLLPELQVEHSVKEDLKILREMIFSPKMKFIIPQIFFTGISISYYTGLFVPMIFKAIPDTYSENEKFSMSMSVMILLGSGAVFGTLLTGQVYTRLGHRSANIVNLILLITCSYFVMSFVFSEVYDYRAFLMALSWGAMDASVQTHTYSQLGIQYKNQPQAYSIYNIFQSMSVLLFSIIQTYVFQWHHYAKYAMAIIVMGYIGLGLNFFLRAKVHNKPIKTTSN